MATGQKQLNKIQYNTVLICLVLKVVSESEVTTWLCTLDGRL